MFARQPELPNTKVLLENGWNSKQMITEGEAAIPLETTLHAFRNQEKTKKRSTINGSLKCTPLVSYKWRAYYLDK